MQRKSFYFFCSHIADNIVSVSIIMLQMIITVVVFNLFWNDFQRLVTRNHLYKSLGLENLACITVSNSDDDMISYISQAQGMTPLGENFNSLRFFSDHQEESVIIQPVSYGYAQYFDSALAKGSWHSKNIPKNAVAAVIPKSMSHQYRLGETYTLHDHDNSQSLEVCITGILSGDSMFIPPSGEDSNLLIADMKSQMLVCCDSDTAHLLFGTAANTSVYTIAAQDLKTLESFAEHIDVQKYFYMSVIGAKEDDDYFILRDMGIPLSITLIMLILCIANFSSYSMLSAIKREKEFAIYFICGATWTECLKIQIAEDLTMIALPFLLSVIICNILSIHKEGSIMTVQGMFLSAALCFVIMAASSLAELTRIKKSTPIEIIRRWL